MERKAKMSENLTIRSKDEIECIWKFYKRNQLIGGVIGALIFFLPSTIDVIGVVFFNLKPNWFFDSIQANKISLSLGTIVLIIIVLQTSMFKKYKRKLRDFYLPLNKVVLPYKKAEEDIIYGIQRERFRWVKRGVERLEGLNEYLSEIPEYHELLEKGKNWLRDNSNCK